MHTEYLNEIHNVADVIKDKEQMFSVYPEHFIATTNTHRTSHQNPHPNPWLVMLDWRFGMNYEKCCMLNNGRNRHG